MIELRRLRFLNATPDESKGPSADSGLPLRDPAHHLGAASLPAPREMHGRIMRQRLLCDRGRQPFAVVVFKVGKPSAGDAVVSRLVAAFRSRARVSDEIGWFGRERIAVLLPVTASAGAHQLALAMCDVLAEQGDRPQFQVFVLP